MILDISYSEGTRKIGGLKYEADATLPWMYTFSADGKLWGYCDGFGAHSFQCTPISVRVTEIGDGDGWEGIPESLVRRLPESSRELHAEWLAKQPPSREDG